LFGKPIDDATLALSADSVVGDSSDARRAANRSSAIPVLKSDDQHGRSQQDGDSQDNDDQKKLSHAISIRLGGYGCLVVDRRRADARFGWAIASPRPQVARRAVAPIQAAVALCSLGERWQIYRSRNAPVGLPQPSEGDL
jgi:hypothetical protein